MEKKTILQWFEQAKAEGLEWADAAIKNTKKNKGERPSESMREAVLSAFIWEITPEGHEFWSEIESNLLGQQ